MSSKCPHGRGTPEKPDCYLCWARQNPSNVTGNLKISDVKGKGSYFEQIDKYLVDLRDRVQFIENKLGKQLSDEIENLRKNKKTKKLHCTHCGKSTIVEV